MVFDREQTRAVPIEGPDPSRRDTLVASGRTDASERDELESQTDKSLLGERATMAEKVTLIEFHAHTDGSEFNLSSDLKGALSALGRGRRSEGETEESSVVESLTSDSESEDVESIEYGDEFDEDEDGVEFDEDDGESDEDSGGKKGVSLAGLATLLVLVFVLRKYLGGEDEDPFEEEFGQ